MKNKSVLQGLASWLDVILLLPGMAFIVAGVFFIYRPAGFIVLGGCLIALAFFVANKQAKSSSKGR